MVASFRLRYNWVDTYYSSQCRVRLNTVLIFLVKKMEGYFLRSSEITSFSRGRKFHRALSLSVYNI
jgi:hypothetical protein